MQARILFLFSLVSALLLASSTVGVASFSAIKFSEASSSSPMKWWFQTGVSALDSQGNIGINITIETINGKTGPFFNSFAFWAGEDIGGGGFVQVGYIVDPSENTAKPFFEAFNSTSAVAALNCISCSIGANGTMHTYSMISGNGNWSFYMDNNYLGNVSYALLGAGATSGTGDKALAIAEDAGSNSSSDYMTPVMFENFSVRMSNGEWEHVSVASAQVGLGEGSLPYSGQWPFGLEVVPGTESFEVGSGLPLVSSGGIIWCHPPIVSETLNFTNYVSPVSQGIIYNLITVQNMGCSSINGTVYFAVFNNDGAIIAEPGWQFNSLEPRQSASFTFVGGSATLPPRENTLPLGNYTVGLLAVTSSFVTIAAEEYLTLTIQ